MNYFPIRLSSSKKHLAYQNVMQSNIFSKNRHTDLQPYARYSLPRLVNTKYSRYFNQPVLLNPYTSSPPTSPMDTTRLGDYSLRSDYWMHPLNSQNKCTFGSVGLKTIRLNLIRVLLGLTSGFSPWLDIHMKKWLVTKWQTLWGVPCRNIRITVHTGSEQALKRLGWIKFSPPQVFPQSML